MVSQNWTEVQAQEWSAFVWRSLHFAEMSVGQLASAVGVPVSVVQNWLNGDLQPSIAHCLATATALGVSSTRLLKLAGHREWDARVASGEMMELTVS